MADLDDPLHHLLAAWRHRLDRGPRVLDHLLGGRLQLQRRAHRGARNRPVHRPADRPARERRQVTKTPVRARRKGGASFSLGLGGQLVQRALDSPAQMVALFAQAGDLGPRRSELVAQPLHLIFQLVQLPRPPIRPTDARLRVRQLELQSFDGDLELAALREQVLDEGLRRPVCSFDIATEARLKLAEAQMLHLAAQETRFDLQAADALRRLVWEAVELAGVDEETDGKPFAVLLDDMLVAGNGAARDVHLLEPADRARQDVDWATHLSLHANSGGRAVRVPAVV